MSANDSPPAEAKGIGGKRIMLFIGIASILSLAVLGLRCWSLREQRPHVAPEFAASLMQNALVLDEARVRGLGLSMSAAVEVNGLVFVAPESLQEAPNGYYLWVEDFERSNWFYRIRVTPGLQKDGRVEIVKGIFAEDKIVVNGANKLRFECDVIKPRLVLTQCD